MSDRIVYVASAATVLLCLILLGLQENHGVSAFSSTSGASPNNNNNNNKALLTRGESSRRNEKSVHAVADVANEEDLSTGTRFSTAAWVQSSGRPKRKQKKCGPCPDDNDNDSSLEEVLGTVVFVQQESENYLVEEESIPPELSTTSSSIINNKDSSMDRREAAFAMLGTIWATTTGIASPLPAFATYGNEAKIELPNVAQGLADRNNKQCLVESLGNRECLVYIDPDNKLYQGLDSQKLLQKVEISSVALAKIPALVDEKKWSGVNSILTGPMGELLGVMNQLAPLSTQQPDQSVALAKQVKLQIFAISAAAGRKDGNGIRTATEGASTALVAFVQSL